MLLASMRDEILQLIHLKIIKGREKKQNEAYFIKTDPTKAQTWEN